MKRIVATFAALVVLQLAGAARAQRMQSSHGRSHVLVGVDTEVGVPLGNYADVNSVGGGALVVAEYPMTPVLGLTGRVGFQMHVDRTINNLGSHVNAIPVLLGTKYYIGQRNGLFGALELGIFDLMSSAQVPAGRGATTTVTSSDVKFGLGAGIGFQEDRWNARVSVHSQDVGNFGSAFVITGGIGYQFASF
jgi:hypothetical protein